MSESLIIEIELGPIRNGKGEEEDRHNGDLFCEPAGKILRGAWQKGRLAEDDQRACDAIPDLPGLRIGFDLKARRVRIFDPLKYDSNAERILKAVTVSKQRAHLIRKDQKAGPVPDEVREDLEPEEMARWLMWAWRQTEMQPTHARRVIGEYPEYVARMVKVDRRFTLVNATSTKAPIILEEERAEKLREAMTAAPGAPVGK